MGNERSLHELQQIALFADELPVAIWVGTVPSGDCIYVNKTFRQILGMDPPEGAARGNYVGPYSVHTHSGEPYPEKDMPYERVLAARAPIELDDMVIHRHDGERTYLRVFARPLFDDAGEITHVVEAFTDITREVVSQRTQRDREVQLRQAQRMESLGSLAGGIAHDFNNLLTVIKMIAANMATKPLSDEVRDGLSQIDQVTDSASRLTRALLGFARQGKNLSHRTSINEIAGRVTELARRTVGRNISVASDLCAGPLETLGDPAQLEQLLMNLVLNAKESITSTGRLIIRTFECELGEGEHSELTPGRYACIEVEDTGGGIPAAVRDRIFEPYFTTKTAGAVKGTGLGLATVFGIVENHRGHVCIAKTSHSGTVMRVLLPLAAPLPERRAPTRSPSESKPQARGTVLVVDDEELVLRVTARALEDVGYQVITAPNGQKAVDAVRPDPGKIDAVVLDLVMPVMGGRETYLALKELRPDLPVVLVTGYGLNHEAQELLDLGVREFVAKPFSIVDLSAALSRIVPNRAKPVR